MHDARQHKRHIFMHEVFWIILAAIQIPERGAVESLNERSPLGQMRIAELFCVLNLSSDGC